MQRYEDEDDQDNLMDDDHENDRQPANTRHNTQTHLPTDSLH